MVSDRHPCERLQLCAAHCEKRDPQGHTQTVIGCQLLIHKIYDQMIGLPVFLGFNHHLEHIPHFFGNLFEQVELSGALEPFAAINHHNFAVDVG